MFVADTEDTFGKILSTSYKAWDLHCGKNMVNRKAKVSDPSLCLLVLQAWVTLIEFSWAHHTKGSCKKLLSAKRQKAIWGDRSSKCATCLPKVNDLVDMYRRQALWRLPWAGLVLLWLNMSEQPGARTVPHKYASEYERRNFPLAKAIAAPTPLLQ